MPWKECHVVDERRLSVLVEIKNGKNYHQTTREKRLRLERQRIAPPALPSNPSGC